MPRFYFDVHDGQPCGVDEDGVEFPGLADAEQAAVEAAAGIAKDRLPRADVRAIEIGVRDAQGRRLVTVRVSLEIERIPAP